MDETLQFGNYPKIQYLDDTLFLLSLLLPTGAIRSSSVFSLASVTVFSMETI